MRQEKDSFAKITAPNLARTFLRKRLMRLLDNGRKKKVIWVHGPAGAGKTTLVASYLKEYNLPTLWYQVDGMDGDVANLFFYLKTLAKEAFHDNQVSLPLLSPEYRSELTTFTRRYFQQFSSLAKQPCVIVFDNYQEAPFESMFHQVLCEGLSVIPKKINVILISRKPPHHSFSGIRTEGEMKTIGWKELCLTSSESKGVARTTSSNRLPDDMVQQLNDRAEGWIAGLLLMLESVTLKENTCASFIESAPEMMFDYFSKEIFHSMDSQTQEFLCKTSILPNMTAEMAVKLTGNRQANSILARLNHNNFFTVIKQVQTGPPVYQYHALFSEFLWSIATDRFTSTTLSHIQKLAAGLLEESGQVSEAAELHCKYKEWEYLAQLICRHVEKLITNGMHQLLWKWLKDIPDSVIKKKPWLIYWQGVISMLISPSKSIDYFEESFNVFKATNEKDGTLLALSGAIDAITNESNDFTLLDPWIKELDKLKNSLDVSAPGKIEYQVIGIIFFAIILRQPEHSDYDKWKEMALELYKKSPDPNLKVFIAWPLGLHYYWSGDTPNTRFMSNDLERLTATDQITPLRFIMAKLIETLCKWMIAMFEGSIEAATAGLEVSRITGIHLWDLHLLTICVASTIGTGNMEITRKYIEQMKVAIKKEESNFNLASYYIMICWDAILRQDFTNAKVYAEMALKLSEDLQAMLPMALSHYAVAQIANEMKNEKKADEHLKNVFHIAFRMKSSFVEFMCHIAKAQFAFNRGKNKRAITYLRDAMTIGRKSSLINFFLWRPEVMAALCVKALENGIEKEYVQGLIRTRSLVPDTPPLNLPDWPWQLKLYTLGQFNIVKDGKPLQFSVKLPRKPIAMLKILIMYGKKGINENEMSDLLWPDAEGDAAHNSFSVTLKRLRELINVKGIILFQDGYLTINTRLCWIDAWEFERIVMKVDEQKKEWGKKRPKEDVNLTERAINIYKGPFHGSDIETMQQTAFTNRLKTLFINCIINLGFYMEQSGNLKKAITLYQKGLETDSTSEKFYQRLIYCYKQLGHKTIAVDYYKQCKKAIAKAYGTDVSDETNDIYMAIFTPQQ